MILKAVLEYTDLLQDGRKVFRILAQNGLEIVRTRTPWFATCPHITIRAYSYKTLNKALQEMNAECEYEVRVVRCKELIRASRRCGNYQDKNDV